MSVLMGEYRTEDKRRRLAEWWGFSPLNRIYTKVSKTLGCRELKLCAIKKTGERPRLSELCLVSSSPAEGV